MCHTFRLMFENFSFPQKLKPEARKNKTEHGKSKIPIKKFLNLLMASTFLVAGIYSKTAGADEVEKIAVPLKMDYRLSGKSSFFEKNKENFERLKGIAQSSKNLTQEDEDFLNDFLPKFDKIIVDLSRAEQEDYIKRSLHLVKGDKLKIIENLTNLDQISEKYKGELLFLINTRGSSTYNSDNYRQPNYKFKLEQVEEPEIEQENNSNARQQFAPESEETKPKKTEVEKELERQMVVYFPTSSEPKKISKPTHRPEPEILEQATEEPEVEPEPEIIPEGIPDEEQPEIEQQETEPLNFSIGQGFPSWVFSHRLEQNMLDSNTGDILLDNVNNLEFYLPNHSKLQANSSANRLDERIIRLGIQVPVGTNILDYIEAMPNYDENYIKVNFTIQPTANFRDVLREHGTDYTITQTNLFIEIKNTQTEKTEILHFDVPDYTVAFAIENDPVAQNLIKTSNETQSAQIRRLKELLPQRQGLEVIVDDLDYELDLVAQNVENARRDLFDYVLSEHLDPLGIEESTRENARVDLMRSNAENMSKEDLIRNIKRFEENKNLVQRAMATRMDDTLNEDGEPSRWIYSVQEVIDGMSTLEEFYKKLIEIKIVLDEYRLAFESRFPGSEVPPIKNLNVNVLPYN